MWLLALKNAAGLLNRNYVNKRGLDLSKEVLWVSVGQLAAKLQAVKVKGLKKILPRGPPRTSECGPGSIPGRKDHPPTLTASCNFEAS